jgi:hypothetical protein
MGQSSIRAVKEHRGRNFSCPAPRCRIACAPLKSAANVTIPASSPARLTRRPWRIVPLLALGFFILTSAIRIHRIEYVSGVAAGPADGAASTPRLIIPGHRSDSFEWLDQTLQMFAKGEWRIRRVDYENAPYGREVNSA